MEEMIDVIDAKSGLKTGEVISKSEAHSKGVWHTSIHIIIISKDYTKILLQKRCKAKSFYPNIWDFAVGGHVSSNESPIEAANRELKEELGLISSKIQLLKVIRESLINGNIKSNEYVYVYLINDDIKIQDIVLQTQEVSDVRWFTKEEFLGLIKNDMIIPHDEEFKLIKAMIKY